MIRPFAPSTAEREDVLLALVEALSNAFRRGNLGRRDRSLVVGVWVSGRQVRLVIRDQGAGFAVPRAPSRLVGPDRESGRGLFLIEQIMDTVRWMPGGSGIALTRAWRPPDRRPAPPVDRAVA